MHSAFMAEAAASHRSAADAARELMRDYVAKQQEERAYKAFLEGKVGKARSSLAAGHGLTTDEVEAQMRSLPIRNLSHEAQRAPKVRAARKGRSAESKSRDNLEATVRPANRVCIGTAMATLSQEAGLANADCEGLGQHRDRAPATPMSFEK